MNTITTNNIADFELDLTLSDVRSTKSREDIREERKTGHKIPFNVAFKCGLDKAMKRAFDSIIISERGNLPVDNHSELYSIKAVNVVFDGEVKRHITTERIGKEVKEGRMTVGQLEDLIADLKSKAKK